MTVCPALLCNFLVCIYHTFTGMQLPKIEEASYMKARESGCKYAQFNKKRSLLFLFSSAFASHSSAELLVSLFVVGLLLTLKISLFVFQSS